MSIVIQTKININQMNIMKLKIRYLHSKMLNMKKITSITRKCLLNQKKLKSLFSTQNLTKKVVIKLPIEKCLLDNLTKQKGHRT